ncbi:MAG TPA: hypothetical protein VGW76_12460 [Pyrinomonadaceae bacterium]|nr:hypothetical protein [Pyrinomonadaceae bacterium]
MNRKECRDTRREIDELEIDQQPSGTALRHLAVCATCSQFQKERAELRELVAGLEPVSAPADFDMRLRARMAAERQAERRQPFFARLIGTPALATAAAMVLFIGAAVWISQGNNEQSGPVAKQSPAKPSATSASVPVQPNATGNNAQQGNDGLVAVNTPAKIRTPLRPASYTRDMNLKGAGDPIRQNDANQAFVNAPSRPVEVSVEDQSGKKRKISLPPVSFGAQTLVDNRMPVSYAGNSRVW